jgi:hypothetical protein
MYQRHGSFSYICLLDTTILDGWEDPEVLSKCYNGVAEHIKE